MRPANRRKKLRRSYAFLFGAVLTLGLSGCAAHLQTTAAHYQLYPNGSFPLLVPDFSSTLVDGDFQTTTVLLQDGEHRTAQTCTLNEGVFSLSPIMQTPGQWSYKSLSVAGWNTIGDSVDINSQWQQVRSRLRAMQNAGCFSQNTSLTHIERVLAGSTPLPAGEIQAFLYADGNEGYFNLAPGMEMTIQTLPTASAIASTKPIKFNSLRLRVRGDDRGVFLSATGHGPAKVASIPKDFHDLHLMRLFLLSQTDRNSGRSAMLLGASNNEELESRSRLIEKSGSAYCIDDRPRTKCVVFKNDQAVSLLATLIINGHPSLYPMGIQLIYVTAFLPPSEQAVWLSSVRVVRTLKDGTLAEVRFPRTLEDARQVDLLPGDQITWSRQNNQLLKK